jgi:methylthioribose-1-phosphate isomerase
MNTPGGLVAGDDSRFPRRRRMPRSTGHPGCGKLPPGMRVGDSQLRTIWVAEDGWSVNVIDQTRLPHTLVIERLVDLAGACRAIRDMQVRGAPLIGATAAYGVCLGLREDHSPAALETILAALASTRPTAVNLRWALDQMRAALAGVPRSEWVAAAYARAAALCDEDVARNRALGQHGLSVLRRLIRDRPLRVLTHCNAGWLATVDWGTALAPVYAAHDAGLPVEVWVSETRPRNQGLLTAWELAQYRIPHTVVADNAAGHLMQRGLVDVCITGTDRTTATGDVCNKIGTYLKALAARACRVPFYVGVPGSSIDWSLEDGADIPIEERSSLEVTSISGRAPDGTLATIALIDSAAANPAFDVTPAALVTGLITERGVCAPGDLRALYDR